MREKFIIFIIKLWAAPFLALWSIIEYGSFINVWDMEMSFNDDVDFRILLDKPIFMIIYLIYMSPIIVILTPINIMWAFIETLK